MEISVDLQAAREFVEGDKFLHFLLDNASDFGISAFILQAILDKISEYEEKGD